MRPGEIVSLDELGQAEIGHPDVAVGVEQEVGGLDVAVDDVLAMGIIERIGDLGSQPGDFAEVSGFGLTGERTAAGATREGLGGRGRARRPVGRSHEPGLFRPAELAGDRGRRCRIADSARNRRKPAGHEAAADG